MKTFSKVLNIIWKCCSVAVVTGMYGIGFAATLKFFLSE